jgi:hypothetical protein
LLDEAASQAHINALGKRKEHHTHRILAGDSCCTDFSGSCQSPGGDSKHLATRFHSGVNAVTGFFPVGFAVH